MYFYSESLLQIYYRGLLFLEELLQDFYVHIYRLIAFCTSFIEWTSIDIKLFNIYFRNYVVLQEFCYERTSHGFSISRGSYTRTLCRIYMDICTIFCLSYLVWSIFKFSFAGDLCRIYYGKKILAWFPAWRQFYRQILCEF